MLKTIEAQQRLAQSHLAPFKLLANNLLIWVRNGVPLSTGNPVYRTQLTGWISGTLRGSGLGLTSHQIDQADTTLWRLFASQTALPARALDNLVVGFQRVNAIRAATPPPHHLTAAEIQRAIEQTAIGLALELSPQATRDAWRTITDYILAHQTEMWVGSIVGCLALWTRPAVMEICFEKLAIEFTLLLSQRFRDALKILELWLLGGRPGGSDPIVPRGLTNLTAPTRSMNPTTAPGMPAIAPTRIVPTRIMPITMAPRAPTSAPRAPIALTVPTQHFAPTACGCGAHATEEEI